LRVIIEEDIYDHEFVAARTENYEELQIVTEKYTPEYVEKITGVPEEQLRAISRLYASPGKKCAIFYGMGLAHHTAGTDNVKCVANIAMLCGKMGMSGGGVNPLRGQNNVQGACDMGALFNTLPGYAGLSRDDIFDRYESMWGVTLPRRPADLPRRSGTPFMTGRSAVFTLWDRSGFADPNANHAVEALKKA